ncbi:hypothetical protein O7627_15315 [Solwaraspora sp. WMMD1047]|uniref:hypothetical protein n=1 Tax=Solwaraspora sp. WMMD1047 TaxID=3016102 RepID=UPI002415AE40|nr:hypothetical protein [Solwaraspora sp. WMMD1047]MDG4830662.1 hypothetical protein [Solwaraspora sp. WMMD1047]
MPTSTLAGALRTPGTDAQRAPGVDGPLRLGRPAVRTFGRRRRPEPTAKELVFLSDLLAEFGMEVDLERYARGGGNTFIDMCAELLDGLDRALPPLETVLLAFHLPDLSVVEVAGSYLAGRCSGDPAVFSVAGQGAGAPFTALRILDCMRPAGDAAGAVLTLDQSTVPYRDPDPECDPVQDCAVLLCTDPAGGPDAVTLDVLDERRVADPADLADALAIRTAPARLVVGPALARRLDPATRARYDVVAGPPGQLCTSAWAALATHWPPDRYTVVADYDPHAERLFQAGLRPGAVSGRSAAEPAIKQPRQTNTGAVSGRSAAEPAR